MKKETFEYFAHPVFKYKLENYLNHNKILIEYINPFVIVIDCAMGILSFKVMILALIILKKFISIVLI